jgi:hypothetical protein
VQSVGGKLYEYVAVDDYTRAVYTNPLRLKSEAIDAFKSFKAAVENESKKKLREIMTDNARELSMGRCAISTKKRAQSSAQRSRGTLRRTG